MLFSFILLSILLFRFLTIQNYRLHEYYNEGKTQGICVFGSGYYKKADTLILSARIGDEIIETVEVDLRTLEVVQCHGKHNQDTEYHERIIDLVNKNANLIRERMKAA